MDADVGEVVSRDSTSILKEAVLTAHTNKLYRYDLERIKRALVNHTNALRQEADHMASACGPSSGLFNVKRQMEQLENRLDKLDLQLETHLSRIKHRRTKTNTEFAIMD